MKYVVTALIVLLCGIGFSSMTGKQRSKYVTHTLEQFEQDARAFAAATKDLKAAAEAIAKDDTQSVVRAKEALIACRLRYKRIEFFMEYFFEYPVNLYNRAPVYEVEEPYYEYQSPVGMQVIEGLLDEDDVYAQKKEITDQCDVINSTAQDIPSLLYDMDVADEQVLEAVRLELVRIIALGITGYDAPVLKTGIAESAVALKALKENLLPLLEQKGGAMSDSVQRYLLRGTDLLDSGNDFDRFDRMNFLVQAALPLQRCFGAFVKEQGLDINMHKALSHDAPHLYSSDAIDVNSFSAERAGNKTIIAALGKELFFEKNLSGNGSRNCATCHQPGKYFTDGLAKSRTLDEKGTVTRNAPTLLYAALQHTQFHDGRAGSLEEQIKAVLQNPLEMDADTNALAAYINNDAHYRERFAAVFPGAGSFSITHIATAIAAYEQTLLPFSSPFDKYIAGDASAMTTEQVQGFNLFMGKAQCGTCHFAPVFNGLLPPYYETSELEVLGVPAGKDKKHLRQDTDSGRYHFFPISFNNGAFKTSTVRNAAMTAPYMHNGVFATMDEVIDFYNKGGGKGMGMAIDNQTLSDKKLKLTKAEVRQLRSFIEALTDDLQALQ